MRPPFPALELARAEALAAGDEEDAGAAEAGEACGAVPARAPADFHVVDLTAYAEARAAGGAAVAVPPSGL